MQISQYHFEYQLSRVFSLVPGIVSSSRGNNNGIAIGFPENYSHYYATAYNRNVTWWLVHL